MEKMTFFKAVKTCFCKYCVFKGRARRAEYWYFFLFNFLVSLVFTVGMVANIVKMSLSGEMDAIDPDDTLALLGAMGPWFYMVLAWGLFTLLPTLGVSVRRLHDTGRSGWWFVGYYAISVVLSVVPVMATGMGAVASGIVSAVTALFSIFVYIILIVWFATDGQRFENKYGPDPKGEPAVIDVVPTPVAEETVAVAEETAAEPAKATEEPAPTE